MKTLYLIHIIYPVHHVGWEVSIHCTDSAISKRDLGLLRLKEAVNISKLHNKRSEGYVRAKRRICMTMGKVAF